ncbi:MAG TPA: hypothetical protein VK206_00135 [Anaerolineales bacterium]|nr:hypothetical protein [Anaerolineales bacterium]
MRELIDYFPLINFIICLGIFLLVSIAFAWSTAHLTSRNIEKLTDYRQAKQQMINALKKSIEAQNRGQFEQIKEGYEQLDMALPRKAGPKFDKLLNALYFWDCWIDDCNHGWRQYKGMSPEEWLRLAKLIITELEADQEIIHHLKEII